MNDIINSNYKLFITDVKKLVNTRINDEYVVQRGISLDNEFLSFLSILKKDLDKYTNSELIVYSKLLIRYKLCSENTDDLLDNLIKDIIDDSWIEISYVGSNSYYICDNKDDVNSYDFKSRRLFILKNVPVDTPNEFCNHLIYEPKGEYVKSNVDEIISDIRHMFINVTKNGKKITDFNGYTYPVFDGEYEINKWLSKFDTRHKYNINTLTFKKDKDISLLADDGTHWIVNDKFIVRRNISKVKSDKSDYGVLQKYTGKIPDRFKDKYMYELLINDRPSFLITIEPNDTNAYIDIATYIINGLNMDGTLIFDMDNMVEPYMSGNLKFDGSMHMNYGDEDGYIYSDIMDIKDSYLILEAIFKLGIYLSIIHDNMYISDFSYDKVTVNLK